MATVDVVLTAGQSNMVGTTGAQGKNNHPDTNATLCLEWNGGPGLVQCDDDISSAGEYKAQTGSLLPSFSNTYTAYSARPLVVVRAAVGGTALLESNANSGALSNGHWDTTGARFGNSVTRLQDAIADIQALGHTIGRVFVIWSQGHKDADKGNNLNLYEAATAALVSRWRTALSIPTLKVYMELLSSTDSNSSTPPVQPKWQTVRDAQINACAATEGLEMAFTEGTRYYERAGWHKNPPWDSVHYSQVGQNYFGQKLAQFIAEDQGLSEPVDPPPAEPGGETSDSADRLRDSDPLPPLPKTFSTAGETSWVVPDFTTSIGGEAIGGGGPGAGSNLLINNGGGGCGGAYVDDYAIPVTAGETLTIVVDAGGPAGPAGGGATTPGGPSGIKRGATWLLKADGGPGGLGSSPYTGGSNANQVANSIGDTKTAGTSGQDGGNSGTIGHGGAAASGGSLTGGAGGTADTTTGSTSADPGDAPGGGGSGKRNTLGTGGAGAKGVVYIKMGS